MVITSMEAAVVTRKTKSPKSKKGGKGNQVISAEDEARRREAVREALRQRLELERKALQVVEGLLEDRVTEQFLVECAWDITPANYKDTVEERSIAKLCGYPVCSNKLTNVPTQQYKISTKTNRVYDITERKCFCSNFCYKASKCFEFQISKIPLWLRKEESPPEVKLMKQGDGGSSGQEIQLIDKPVSEAEIENPTADNSESSREFSQSDHSDTEQDFVSSVGSKLHKHAKVHWAKLPEKDGVSENIAENTLAECTQRCDGENNDNCDHSQTSPLSKEPNGFTSNSAQDRSAECDPEEIVDSLSESGSFALVTGDLDITRVGMSRRAAAGLKGFLKDYNKPKSTPATHTPGILEVLKQTLIEWRTEETLKFLYGPEYTSRSDSVSAVPVKEEELDEDDLEDEEGLKMSTRPSAPAPDIETLRKQTEMLELQVKEFYKGTYTLPKDDESDAAVDAELAWGCGKDPPLPLVDSQAQHLIQKRIVVEKLKGSLRDVVGALHLTMNEVINDVNNLVRTFRFTNTNIIHKTPEWTLISVVLLSV
ncbi:hypothetical protein DNTS_007087 [Danionella cerebrum]|nr:hypothetical protein DNTS_007087 [Danionella translucida]